MGEQLIESWSEEDYDKYLPDDFNPIDRDGGIGHEDWGMPGNPDDADSALWGWFKDEYLPRNYPDLTEKDYDDLAKIIANAFWAGNSVGHKNGLNANKD